MDMWTRIGDDEIAPFGTRVVCFTFPGGTYTISVDQSEQNLLTVTYNGEEDVWDITTKEISDQRFKLSGGADWIPELMDNFCWYELVLDENAKITYWSDREIYRVDREVK